MKQVFHIFQKDARHFWLEIAVSIALVATYVWSEIHSWTAPEEFSGGFVGFLRAFPTILVFLSWWFTIARIVQDEALVGDRQFWITRPYEWKKLLAAKVLFVTVFINLPLLIAQVVLLAKAGFNPVLYLPGLLFMQFLLAIFLLMPLAAVATVTSSVVQMGLASLIIVLYIVGVAALSSYIPSSSFSFEIDDLQPAIMIGAALVVIGWQYARRKTVKSRLVMAGAAAAIVLLQVATPYGILVARNYPELGPGEELPVRIELAPLKRNASEEMDDFSNRDTVQIDSPWTLSGVANESIIDIKGLMVAIEAPGNVKWNSGWVSQATFLYPGQKDVQLTFELPRAFYERAKSLSVKTRVSLIMTVYHDKNKREFVIPAGEFVLPEVGLCSAKFGYSNLVHCRAALKKPSSLLVSSDLSLSTCPARERELPAQPGEMGHAWEFNSESGPAAFGLSPILSFDLYLSPANYKVYNRGVCPGTPLVLSNPEVVEAIRTTPQMDSMRLADYRFVFAQFSDFTIGR
jgi:hypothetical protein